MIRLVARWRFEDADSGDTVDALHRRPSLEEL